jgi:hypothetical protein
MKKGSTTRRLLLASTFLAVAILFPIGALTEDARLSDAARVPSARPDTNFGSGPNLRMRTSTNRNFVKLDLSTLTTGAQERNSSRVESRYSPADTDLFGMNITVVKSDLGDQYHLQVDFTVPTFEAIADFNLITIYGLREEGGKRTDLPHNTFPSVRGNWKSGDRVTLQIDLPKKFANPAQGWNLTFCVGTPEQCLPSPNLLIPAGTGGTVVESLKRIKAALEYDSNVRASSSSDNPLVRYSHQISNSYRITRIHGCLITLVHTSTSVDHNYDGGQSTATALVNLANLSSDAKVSKRSYGIGWRPSSRWVLSDRVIDGRVPISTETVIKSFPGQGRVDKSKSRQIEIEFTDRDVAEVVRKMLIHEIVACGEAK